MVASVPMTPTIPDLVAAATYNPEPCSIPGPEKPSDYCEGALEAAYNSWFSGTHQDHAYLPYLGHFVEVLVVVSGGLVLLAVLGFLGDRYSGECVVALRVIDAEENQQIFPDLEQFHVIEARTPTGISAQSRQEAEKVLLEGLARKVGHVFAAYEVEERSEHPEVQ